VGSVLRRHPYDLDCAVIRYAITRLRLAYYSRALSDMGIAHPDAGAVLLHISALRDQIRSYA
jgi:hypothetical protein